MVIEVKKIVETNIDDVNNITLSHRYDKFTKTLFFNVRATKGCTTKRNAISTTHPKYEYGTE